MDILSVLRGGPATISRIAASLGVHPANLTRHLRTLVDAGLVELDHTRDTGRNLEKYYRSVSDTFDVSPGADGYSAPHKVALEYARSDLAAAIVQLPESVDTPVIALVVAAKVRREDLQEYCRRMEALAKEFESADADNGIEYHINLSAYPGSWNSTDGVLSIQRTRGQR